MRQIGFWGVPGFESHTKTHIVEDGKNICGTLPHPKAEFQFCAAWPSGLVKPECRRCAESSRREYDFTDGERGKYAKSSHSEDVV